MCHTISRPTSICTLEDGRGRREGWDRRGEVEGRGERRNYYVRVAAITAISNGSD